MHTCPGIYIDQPNTNHFFIVIPYVNGNIIIGLINNLIPQKMLWKITNKVNNSFKNEISILNFVETLVISSPDGTYFSPDVIESMEDTKRKAFTEDCMFLHEFLSSEKYFSDYDLSIFDHVRSNLFTKLSIESQDVIAKIYSIPARKSYEERLYEMKDKIDKENIILQTLN
ncbi:hypothetical protein DN586_24340 [Enterobacter cloacae]|nr:hypothetical protein DN586_24340 [Enterobacter cloacae]